MKSQPFFRGETRSGKSLNVSELLSSSQHMLLYFLDPQPYDALNSTFNNRIEE